MLPDVHLQQVAPLEHPVPSSLSQFMIISIAGLKISVQQGNISPIYDRYRGFITDNKTDGDIKLAIDYSHESFKKNGQTSEFRASNWQIYWEDPFYSIPIFLDYNDDLPYITIIADKKFTHIKIIIHKNNFPPELPLNKVDPLDFPMDELILLNYMGKNQKGILLHAAGIVYEGKGYLFPGFSTAGKSTISRLFLNDGRATVLSDDRIILRYIDDQFYIYGTPWHGEADIFSNEGAPLQSIYFLEKDTTNYVKDISQIEKFNKIVQCMFTSFWDKEQMNYNLELLQSLLHSISAKSFYFQPDQKAVDYILEV